MTQNKSCRSWLSNKLVKTVKNHDKM